MPGSHGLLALLTLGLASACGASHAASAPDGGPDASNGTDASNATSCGAGCYAPTGCEYQVAPPESAARALGYTDFSVDTSSPVASTSGATPERVRVGLGGNTALGKPGYADPTTTAVFTWETAEADSNAKVQISARPSSLSDIHTGYTWTSPAALGSSAFHMHEVHVCGLRPATTYDYEVGGGAPGKEVWSARQSFTTVPSSGPVTVGVYGDARVTVSTWQIVNLRMKSKAVNLDLISGDIVELGPSEPEWAQWLDAIWTSGSEAEAGVRATGAFLTLGEQMMVPIAGNHEAESTDFYSNWSIPGAGSYAKTYASFNVGNTHFVLFDDSPMSVASSPEALSPEAHAQLQWLESDLAAASAARASYPFLVVMNHRCLFSTSTHAQDPDVLLVREVLAPLFDKYQVDLVLNGHNHEYERSYPLNANAANPKSNDVVIQTDTTKGTTYVVNAGAGADAYTTDSYPAAYRKVSWEYGFSTGYLGCYAILELEGKSLTMTVYGFKGVAGEDDVIDTLTLNR
jgi:acid phosphatase type 7